MPGWKLLAVLSLCLTSTAALTQEAPSERTPLAMGELYVPDHLTPRDGRVALVVHFHGGRNIMPDAIDALRLNAACVIVNRNGLSSVYREPFENRPNRFSELLADAESALRGRQGYEDAALGPVWIASFSAGYGAVREILKEPANRDRLSGVLLTDSMYASYAPEPPEGQQRERDADLPRTVEPAHVEPYVAFAQRAIAGDKVFVVTHTYLPPGGYAGTHEVAAALVARLGLGVERVSDKQAAEHAERYAVNELHLRDRTTAGNFAVFGYAGDTGQDHGRHLMTTAAWLPMLGIEMLPQ